MENSSHAAGSRNPQQRLPLRELPLREVPLRDTPKTVNRHSSQPEPRRRTNYGNPKAQPGSPHQRRHQAYVPEKENPKSTAGRFSAEAAYSSSPPSMKTPAKNYQRAEKRSSGIHNITSPIVELPSHLVPRKSVKKRFVGPWMLGDTLGAGISGRVLQAKHRVTGELAAVKIMRKNPDAPAQPSDPATKFQGHDLPSALAKEVVVMKMIDHPNVLSLIDVFENSQELYLVLELVDGGELFGYITTFGGLPEHEAINYFRQILSAIEYCQRYGICHRDLKAENILMDRKGNIKVADFGFAALQTRGSRLDTACGSPHYAAPEVISGFSYDGRRSDIWSCGIVLFVLLAGRLPFDHSHTPTLLMMVQRGKFTMPKKLSKDAQDLLSKMLVIEPHKRIEIADIWAHPLMTKYARKDKNGVDLDRGPKALGMDECPNPVNSVKDIDRECLKNLMTVLPTSMREKDVIYRLLSEAPNQEKLLYSLLMKYRYNQLENYDPGTEPDISSHEVATARKVSLEKARAVTVSRHNSQRSKRLSAGPIERTRAELEVNGDLRTGSPIGTTTPVQSPVVPSHPQDGRSVDLGWYTEDDDLVPAKTIGRAVSRASLASSVRTRRAVQRRRNGSRSSILSTVSTSPSAYKMPKVASSGRVRVSFNHAVKPPKATPLVESWVQESVVEDEKIVEDVEMTTPVQTPTGSPTAAIVPQGRRQSNLNNRSTVIIDGLAMGSGITPTHMKKYSLTHDLKFQERKRQVSKELETICDHAFRPSSSHAKLGSWTEVNTLEETGRAKNDRPPNGSSLWGTGEACLSSACNVCSRPPAIRHSDPREYAASPLANRVQGSLRVDNRNTLDILEGRRGETMQSPRLGSPRTLGMASPDSRRVVSQYDEPNQVDFLLTERYRGVTTRRSGRVQAVHEHRVASAPPQATLNPQLRPTAHRARTQEYPSRDREQSPRVGNTVRLVVDNSGGVFEKVPTQESIEDKHSTGRTSKPKNEYTLFPKSPTTSAESIQPLGVRAPVYEPAPASNVAPFAAQTTDRTIKKKRSILDLFTKKPRSDASDGTSEAEPGDRKSAVMHGAVVEQHSDRLGPVAASKEAQGKFRLGRWAGRSTKKPLVAVEEAEDGFAILEDHTEAAPAEEDFSDDEAIWGNRDEYKRVQSTQNWLLRFLNVKPASRIACMRIPAATVRKEVSKLWAEWEKHGLVVIQDDRKALIMRARVDPSNSSGVKEVYLVVEIRIFTGSRKRGMAVARFTQEKGAASTFHRVFDETVALFSRKGFMIEEKRKRARMERVFS